VLSGGIVRRRHAGHPRRRGRAVRASGEEAECCSMNEPDLATEKEAPSRPATSLGADGNAAQEASETDASEAEQAPQSTSQRKQNGEAKRDRSKQVETPRRWSWAPGGKREVPAVRYEELTKKRPTSLLCVDNISVSFDGFKALTDL